ncbi:putative transcriptional regulatory protein C139,03 [Talaromyces islandicus]|uniref:Putative transcriptional regulatory protein C139,03 n=1 Tax=Talaromyces islandicus TaxID=28573 RepID=A0A0U1M658_TALIS|nr:putative transcriptional regulatory protein C139,03 [Talaromyces islandicus]
MVRKTPTLRDISSCLERLETLLSRFAESGEVTTRPVVDGSGGRVRSRADSDIQIQVRSGANVNASEKQHPFDRPPNKSTWEILLNNSDDEPLLQDEPTGLETAPSPRVNTTAHHRLPTQPSACAPLDRDSEPLGFYPDTQLALRLWDVYVKSVDPVLKILHIPTVQSAVVVTILDPGSAQPSTLALTFAIYYAAVTALCHDDSDEPVDLPCEKPVLLKRYQTALDRFLVTPDLMNRPEVAGLQALAIYVTCLRAHELGRRVWVLNGLAIRLSQSIGLHRDGTSLNLSPFETEMRLRLWWHLCVLDSRAPEDQGFPPTVDLTNQELRLPLNVNDDQIYPDMKNLPAESDGWTEMSFFLIQTKSCRVIHPVLDHQQQHSVDVLLDIREKRKMIQDPGQYLSAKYGIPPRSGTSTDLQRIATQHVTTACRKMEFVLQLREEICMRKKNEVQDDATPDVLKLSFKLACDALESSYVLLKDGLAWRFKWFFNMYTQWYALAYVLRCLRSSPCGFEADRGWASVEALFPRGTNLQGHDEHGHGRIWKFLKLLRHQAWSLRQHAQQLSTATTDHRAQPSSNGRYFTSQIFQEAETPQPGADQGTSILPEWGYEFVANPDERFASSLNLLMPEIPFLPDWNAVINGQ